MQTPTPAMNRNRNQDLDPLRLRLVQLIDAVSHLQSQLAAYQHHPSPTHALPPFLELVNRYNLLLTNLAAIHRLVSSEQDQQDQLQPPPRRAGESADPKRDKWDSLAVVPAQRVDEAKDWIVGTLLRTKQTPEIEQAQQSAASSLPEPFLSALSSPKEPPQAPPASSFAALSQAQARLVTAAHQKIVALKQFSAGGGEEWDWKARVELDQEEEEEEDVVMEKGSAAAGSDWTLRDLHVFMQTGKRPST
ncbi:hypothetical protein JCM8115_001054 [Rhodotorula mucilaginosa]